MSYDRQCVACASSIDAQASLCPSCSTRQNPAARWAVRVGAVLSAASVLLSVITVAVSFFPSAWSAVFPQEHARLYEIGFDRANLKRSKARVSLANYGNQDLFVARIKLEPADPDLAEITRFNYVVSEWLRVAENRTFLVPLGEKADDYSTIPVDGLPARRTRLAAVGLPDRGGCFTFLVHSADENGPRPIPAHREVGAVFEMAATLYYSSVKSGGALRTLGLPFPLTASLMYREACDKELQKREAG